MKECVAVKNDRDDEIANINKAGNISVNFKKEDFSEDIKKKSLEIGKVYNFGSVVEVNTHKSRYQLKEYEAYLEENKIPHELYIGGTESNPPRVKKYNPNESISKEIDCYCYTGQDHGDEDGIVSVTELEEIISSSNKDNLLKNIQKLIEQRRF